jgi:uncharacterized membrane protein
VNTYLWLKLVHVLSAIVAVGANVTYFVWFARARRDPVPNPQILDGIKAIDARLANPAYVVLPVTGILMVLDGDLGFTTFWILAAYATAVRRSTVTGLITMVPIAAILYMMVMKPTP